MPGNAGSYEQVRSLAAESARQTQRLQQSYSHRHCSLNDTVTGPTHAFAIGDEGCDSSGENLSDKDANSRGGLQGLAELAWYSADFGEELSAFDGNLLVSCAIAISCLCKDLGS